MSQRKYLLLIGDKTWMSRNVTDDAYKYARMFHDYKYKYYLFLYMEVYKGLWNSLYLHAVVPLALAKVKGG